MSSTARLVLLHRSLLFRQCLKCVLEQQHAFESEEVDARGLNQVLDLHAADGRPCVVLIDVGLPEGTGMDLIQTVRQSGPHFKVIALVPLSCRERILDTVASGAHACVLEEASLDELIQAIHAVSRGETYCSGAIVDSLFRQVGKLTRFAPVNETQEPGGLTRRELEILQCMARRLSNKEIARKLSVSVYTIKNHVHNILEKLGVENRFEAVEQARDRSWLSQL